MEGDPQVAMREGTADGSRRAPAPAGRAWSERFAAEYRELEGRLLDWMGASGSGSGEDAFEEHAAAVHRFQFDWNLPYRRFCESLGRGAAVATAGEIPAVPTEAFRNPDLPVASFPPAAAEATFRTSGTTGDVRGIHHFHDTTLYREAIRLGWDRTAGLGGGAPVLAVLPSPVDAPDSSLSFMFGELTRPDRFFLSGEGGMRAAALAEVIAAHADEPVILAGTAIGLLRLLEGHPDLSFALPPGSRIVQTGGYKGTGRSLSKEDLYARLEERFGVPAVAIIDEYGMTELTSQFYAAGCGTPHRGPHWVRIRLVDPESGVPIPEGDDRPGQLEILDVANLGSVMGIRTRDLAVRRDEGFLLLGRDPAALPRGCSRSADALLAGHPPLLP